MNEKYGQINNWNLTFRILNLFNTNQEEYSVIFTSGATQGLKLIAETFDFNGGRLVYLEDNHTSVLGMRNLVSDFRELKVTEAFNILSSSSPPSSSSSLLSSSIRESKNPRRNTENCLFVYPAQSNFAGNHFTNFRNQLAGSRGLEN